MITPGTILIERGTPLPPLFHLEDQSDPSAWIPIKSGLSSPQLESELASLGWTFFYMAGGITATAFGFDRLRTLRRALKRLIASVRVEGCNCLIIDEVATHAFGGMPYVNLSAHLRHLQQGSVFASH